jgi:hypothetical protein
VRESMTVDGILSEARAKRREEGFAVGLILGFQRSVLVLGLQRFGEPPSAVRQTLEAITDIGRLGRMVERLLQVGDWDELMATA